MKMKYKGILIRIRKSKVTKAVSVKIILLMVFQFFTPFIQSSYALTSGPGQQEYASFEPASTSDMVDLYSGDFTYNIPLINIPGPNGGYPLNLAYHANVGMEQEASWVGLGWTLNVGAINRQLQGIPDDFDGTQKIRYEKKQKRNVNVDVDISSLVFNGTHSELFGFNTSSTYDENALTLGDNDYDKSSLQLYFNNFKGIGIRGSTSFGLENVKGLGKIGKLIDKKLSPALNLSYDSQNGIGINPSFQILGSRINLSINNRRGFNSMSFSNSYAGNSIRGRKKDLEIRGGGSPLSFSSQSYLPSVSNPVREWNFPISFKIIGKSSAFGNWNAGFPKNNTASVSFQDYIDDGIYLAPAYGYLNANNSTESAVNDYQKQNIQYSKKTPYLSPSRNTYDILAYSAQGAGGSLRGYHPDMLFYHDPKIENPSLTIGLNVEFAKATSPPPSHIGIDANIGFGNYWSGAWEDGDLGNSEPGSNGSVSSYIKNFGEQTAIFEDETNLDEWRNDEAVRFKLGKTSGYLQGEYKLENEMLYDENNPAFSSVPLTTQDIDRRNTDIRYLTNNMSYDFGFSRIENGNCGVKFYDPSTSSWNNKNYNFDDNLISEIQVTQPGGTKYIYGLPAYNENHSDILSSTSATGDHQTDYVDLDGDDHETTENRIWNKTDYPTYAHSWLLTSVVAADYIDYDDVIGPSDGDRGYWVKFNYTRTDNDYRWRIPYRGANFIEGNKGDDDDNMATVSTGTKELYYIKTIETKTHVAVFYISPRYDARGAVNWDDDLAGTAGYGGYMQKLDSIELYSKNEYYSDCGRTTINTNAKPLQTVVLKYDYSLCQNVLNNDGGGTGNAGGKLTLKEVYFTSENSKRGKLSPYKFTYQNNKNYDIRNMDRWGNFKANVGAGELYGTSTNYPYKDFPYTEQPRAIDNPDYIPPTSQWALSQVDLPTGGIFHIEYEANDYAYVEGKPAMRMFDIIGIGNAINATTGEIEDDGWYSSSTSLSGGDTRPHRLKSTATYGKLENKVSGVNDGYRIYFELEDPILSSLNPGSISNIICNNYLKGIDKIWFRNLTVLQKNSDEGLDYVEGYAEIVTNQCGNSNYFGACASENATSGYYDIGYITVKEVPLQENRGGIAKCNPMSGLALTHMKFERPEIMHPQQVSGNNAINLFSSLILLAPSLLGDAIQMLIGYNLFAFGTGHGKFIKLNGNSIIKLYDPDQRKYGNGARVKKLFITDNWSNSSANDDVSSYGQEYIYTLNGESDGISSGVAYEPSIGAEESALRKPVEYSESHFLASDQTMFVDEPVLESYYPGASVGYSKVTVKSIAPEEAENFSINIDNTAAPISVYEFYTPKDFPVYGDATDVSSDKPLIRVVLVPGFYSDLRIKKARSQGYSIVTNDMAGKSKSVSSYKRNSDGTLGSLLTQQQFIYNTITPYSENGNNKLSSEVQALIPDSGDSDVNFRTAYFGQTVDLFTERNESRNDNWSGGLEVNIELAPIAPIFIPTVSHNEFSFKTVVTHKIIHRSGILTKVIAKTDQSTITTENLAFDPNTGQPLLTSVIDQYETPVYNLSYPAHWYYQNMGPSYINSSLALGNVTVSSPGAMSGTEITNSIDRFTIGDKLFVSGLSGGPYFAHVVLIDDSPSSEKVYCILEDGTPLPNGTASIKMMESGYKNMQPVSSGGVTFKQLDDFSLANTQTVTKFDFDKIINASAVEFSDEWQTECLICSTESGTLSNVINPFVEGIKGLWRMKNSYGFSTKRNYPGNSVEDGFYDEFVQFPWRNPDNRDDRWISGGTVTKYSPFGFELENRDALGNYSAALYGYDNSLPVAVAVNSRFNEIMAENFEDYTCQACIDKSGHKDVFKSYISNNEGHSGKSSLKVGASNISTTIALLDTTVCNNYEGYDHEITLERGEFNLDTDYEWEECECLGRFSLLKDKKYLVSAWVKWDPNTPNRFTTYNGKTKIRVTYTGTSNPTTYVDLVPTGKIIEGWQKIEGEFELPSDVTNAVFTFYNLDNSNGDVFFDDLRVLPFYGNMNTYVYNGNNYKLVAELDENNYATFYIYDEAGNLVMMKKETAEGIKTITEGRSDSPKNQ
jgi:hypothetical protein